MRLVDVVLASALLGLALGWLNMGHPSAARAGTAEAHRSAGECRGALCSRDIWLRAPAMRAAMPAR